MTEPQVTPLLLPSEYNALVTSASFTSSAVLLNWIIEASEYVERICHRRFDERLETRRYTNILERDGGALLDQFSLFLDDDLRTAQQLAQQVPIGGTIDDGLQVNLSGCRLLSSNSQLGTSVTVYDIIHINQFSGSFFFYGGTDPYESIWMKGLWGYGGQWIATGTTIATDQDSSQLTLAVVSGAALEAGMVLKLGTEYQYVESVSTNTATVDRSYNGSVAAAHSAGVAVYRWQPLPTVRGLVRRLIQWGVGQVQSPMAGNVTIGDFSFPVDTSGLPKDLYLKIRDTFIIRLPQAYGV